MASRRCQREREGWIAHSITTNGDRQSGNYIKIPKTECQGDPGIKIQGDLRERGRLEQHNRVYSDIGIAPTIFTPHGGDKSPKIVEESKELEEYVKIINNLHTERGGCGVVTENFNDLRIRYLTPRECLRLMGFDDPSIDKLITAVPSKTNEYKLAGNSIVVDCLEQIFKAIYIDKSFRKPRPKQISLFDIPQRPINPILMRSAEDIEKEVSDLNIRMGRIKDNLVEISGDSIVENSGDYVVGGTAHDQ